MTCYWERHSTTATKHWHTHSTKLRNQARFLSFCSGGHERVLKFTAKLQFGILHLLLVVLVKHFILGHGEMVLPITNFSWRDREGQQHRINHMFMYERVQLHAKEKEKERGEMYPSSWMETLCDPNPLQWCSWSCCSFSCCQMTPQ